MKNNIHPSADISPLAQIGNNVCIAAGAKIGATAQIGDNVTIAENTIVNDGVVLKDNVCIGPFTLIDGDTTIGEGTKVFNHCSIGLAPQDLKYAGEPTKLVIGKNNTIREFVCIHRGTPGGGGITSIGNGNLIMAYVHFAHDCQIGDGNIFANSAHLAGHVVVGDNVTVGGVSALHQFIHIGSYSMIGASSLVRQDILPFALVAGVPAQVIDINRVGLRRKNFNRRAIDAIHKATIYLCRSGLSLETAIEKIRELPPCAEVDDILSFIENRSRRGILRGNNLSTAHSSESIDI